MNVFNVLVKEHRSKYSVALRLVSTNAARVFVELCCCPPSCREVGVDAELQLLLEPAGARFSSRTLEQITQGQSVKLLSPGRMYDHRLKLTPDFFLCC